MPHTAATRSPACRDTRCRATATAVRRVGQNASSSSAAARTAPAPSTVRYAWSGTNVSVTSPPAPAGASQPCCQPSTTIGVSVTPPSFACQPILVVSRTARMRCSAAAGSVTVRSVASHLPIVTADATGLAAAVPAGSRASRSGTPSSPAATTIRFSPFCSATVAPKSSQTAACMSRNWDRSR
jgi:hypothetical protein